MKETPVQTEKMRQTPAQQATWPRVIAAALSLGLTAGVMVLLRVPHPPAGATTLIVSLGLLTRPWQLALLLGAVVVLTGQTVIINRLAGLPYPLWGPPHPSSQAGEGTGICSKGVLWLSRAEKRAVRYRFSLRVSEKQRRSLQPLTRSGPDFFSGIFLP